MIRAQYVVESASTDDVRLHERIEFWRNLYQSRYVRADLDFPDGPAFRGHLRSQTTARYALDRVMFNAVSTARHRKWHEPSDDYRLLLVTGGSLMVRQGDVGAMLAPGDAWLSEPRGPHDLAVNCPELLLLKIPRSEIDNRTKLPTPMTKLDISKGLGRIVAGMLGSVVREREEISGAQFEAVCDRIIELLCMLAVGDNRPSVQGHLAEVETLVRRYVRENARDPQLTGTVVARALGWSLRQVQLALQGVGTTPQELIREERLRLAYDLLQSPVHRHLAVSEVAYASGFCSSSTFNAAFRRRYGARPRDIRTQAQIREEMPS